MFHGILILCEVVGTGNYLLLSVLHDFYILSANGLETGSKYKRNVFPVHKIWRKKKTKTVKNKETKNRTKPKNTHSVTTRRNIIPSWLYRFPVFLLCIPTGLFKDKKFFVWLMRVRAKAKTHEHFPSNQEVPFVLTCPFLKTPNHYKEESFRNTDFDMLVFCFQV